MARKLRLYLPNQPQHIVVRGHNRDPILAHHDDFRFMYSCLKDAVQNYQVKLHAWVFMHNHVHLLATPGDKTSVPRCMQSIGRRYAQYFNRKYHRTGSLWEGRYKSMLVDTDRYLLTCYRYIELNPVRAGLVKHPKDYPYSSYAHNGLGKVDNVITEHELYKALVLHGRDAYVDLFKEALSQKELLEIRRATDKGSGVGRSDFLLRVVRLLK